MENWLQMQPTWRQEIYHGRLGDPAAKKTLRVLAAQLNISPERVRQVENSLMRNLRSYAKVRVNGPMAGLALAVAQEAGTLIPQTELNALLRPGPTTPSHAGATLRLAGTYDIKKGWYHRREREIDNPTDHIKREVARRGWMSVAEAETILAMWGMNPRYVNSWLDSQTNIVKEAEFLLNPQAKVADRAYVALRRLGKPATLPDIARLISYEGTTTRLQVAISQHGLFIKCTRYKYGLKEWNLPHYTSLSKAMRDVLTEHGGSLPLDELQEFLKERFEVPPERTATRAARIRGLRVKNGQVSLVRIPE